MGGLGSGRYPRIGSKSKYYVADHEALRLDIRELYKDGFLDSDRRGRIAWFRHGAEVASIGTYSDPCAFALHLISNVGTPPAPLREVVQLSFTACHFGGDRSWFLCPACGRRCAVLWGRGRFVCRICQRIAYASQNESPSSRAMRRIHEIRARLKVGAAVAISNIVRPKYMRYERYRALFFELLQHEGARSSYVLGLQWALDNLAEDDLDPGSADGDPEVASALVKQFRRG